MTAPNVVPVYRCVSGCDAIVDGPSKECLGCALLFLAAAPPLNVCLICGLPSAQCTHALRLVRGGGRVG